MSRDEGFLAAILANPEDDALRLVFADWLDDHGRHVQAEFIRLQIALEPLAEDDPRREELAAREEELLTDHWRELLGPLEDVLPESDCHPAFQRGFVHEVTFWGQGGARCLVARAAALFRQAPVRWLRLSPSGGLGVSEFPWQPGERFYNDRLTLTDLQAVCALPEMERVTFLDLSGNTLEGPRGGPILVVSNRIGDAGALVLAETPRLSGLETLLLRDNLIGDAGARALVASPHLGRLATLDLTHNRISDACKDELSRSLGSRIVLE